MIRICFVANSSSSSFIVVPIGEPVLTFKIDLGSYSTKVTTIKELDIKLERWWGKGFKEDCSFYEECVELINTGQPLYIGSVCSDNDDALEHLLYDSGFGEFENLKVIMGE